ncbi:hypothetical protein [Pseudotabrizicola formosa]|uniref:hypothetical protein n=1 Tax=Pseudotabrizicola formosa TaxID=2030009 RepID=UPI00143DCDC5|nr:hypothetical protein [Pseudotabrizicola formosa]
MGASKILTVSYGTFSCTLEGFEDPFNTMKAIAEYFRDLAAGDRYFGAEPPQPDAAMLHKIAEREIQRRVEAKVQENGVILRAEEAGTAAAPAPFANGAPAAPQPAPEPVVEMPARGIAPVPRPAPTLTAVEEDAPAGADPAADTVAEKLSRLRKAAAEGRESAAVVTLAAALPLSQEAYTEDQHAEVPRADLVAFEDLLPEAAQEEAADLPEYLLPEAQGLEADQAPEDLPLAPASAPLAADQDGAWAEDDDLADLMALDAVEGLPEDAPAALTQAANDLPDDASEVADDGADDDALLASLRAAETALPEAATQGAADGVGPSTLAEAEADEALLASLGGLIETQAAEASAPPPPDSGADIRLSLADSAPVATDDISDDDAEADAGLEAAVFAAAPVAEQTSGPELDEEADDALLQPLSELSDDMATAEMAEAEAPKATGAEAAPQSAEDAAEADAVSPGAVRPIRPVRPLRPAAVTRPALPELAAEQDDEAGSFSPQSQEKLQRARARVIKIRRKDASVAGPAAPAPAPARATLSQEAEAALTAELAALEQEPDGEPPVTGPTAAAANGHHLDRPAEEVAVSRLMAEASNQMEVPDTKRRRSAIAHLKAAVAATIAERRATGSTLAENGRARMGAYREDLAKVMRPAASAPAPQGERPAPLVLVSAQRIDRPAEVSRAPGGATVVPVRPRRPMSSAALAIEAEAEEDYEDAGNLFEAESGFPEFADRLGATDLPELLEAAAAYIACVEGLDSFTRPQLMRHIGTATDSVSREDGLRSFGILLREGVIERSRRGQFAISDASPLLAQARKIAG